MAVNTTKVVEYITIVGALFASWFFADGYFARAADMETKYKAIDHKVIKIQPAVRNEDQEKLYQAWFEALKDAENERDLFMQELGK